jgi:protein-S-isoprenylcysteine O-methyltransferase Ste14
MGGMAGTLGTAVTRITNRIAHARTLSVDARVYLRLAINEERETRARVNAEYDAYLAAAPRFNPRRVAISTS